MALADPKNFSDYPHNRDAGIALSEEALIEPADVVRMALDGIEAGEIEILDRVAAAMKATLTGPPAAFDLVAAATGPAR